MKYEKEFNEWWLNFPYIPTPQNSFMDLENAKHGWNAAIEFIESRKCEDCKDFYKEDKTCDTVIDHIPNTKVEKDFYCKYWEAKG